MVRRMCSEEGVSYSDVAWSNLYPDGRKLKEHLDSNPPDSDPPVPAGDDIIPP